MSVSLSPSDPLLSVPPLSVPLYRLAHGRTGDKGDRSNISVIAYDVALFDLLAEQLSCERVAQVFSSRRPRHVERYLLPRLAAMNFVLDGVLDGGVNDALNLDAHGKALVFLLLDIELTVPRSLAHLLRPQPEPEFTQTQTIHNKETE